MEASYRCPLVPVHHRPAVAHDSPAMRYAAAVQVLLGDQWLADRGADGRRLARLTRPLLRAPVARAQGLLRDFGVDVGTLDGVERRQQEIEAGRPTPGEAAKPTSSALGLVFAAVADLPGTITAVRSDTGRRRLGALGSTIGSVIYLTDALEDIHEDRRRGNFNPCLEGDVVAPERLRDARQGLSRALERMSALVDRVPWQRHREVIANILCDRLAGQSRRAMEITRLDVDGREGSQHGENGGGRGGEARDNCARPVSQRRSGSATAYLRPVGSTMSDVMARTTGGGPEGEPGARRGGSGLQEQCCNACWDEFCCGSRVGLGDMANFCGHVVSCCCFREAGGRHPPRDRGGATTSTAEANAPAAAPATPAPSSDCREALRAGPVVTCCEAPRLLGGCCRGVDPGPVVTCCEAPRCCSTGGDCREGCESCECCCRCCSEGGCCK